MKNDINRREFLKRAGGAAMIMGGLAAVTGCKGPSASTEAADSAGEGMTYRINPGNGDKVSILGYGCMRWPMIKDENPPPSVTLPDGMLCVPRLVCREP